MNSNTMWNLPCRDLSGQSGMTPTFTLAFQSASRQMKTGPPDFGRRIFFSTIHTSNTSSLIKFIKETTFTFSWNLFCLAFLSGHHHR
jgi:hypothetical protein